MKNIYLILIWISISTSLPAQTLPMAARIIPEDSSAIYIKGMARTFDSCHVLLCQTQDKKLVLAKIDESFNFIWAKKYLYSIQMVQFLKIIQTGDSSLVITGTNISGNTCILKVSKNGDILWSKSFSSYDAFKTNVIETADQNLIVSCRGDDLDIVPTSTFVVKLTQQGSLLWGKKISGYISFTADAIVNTSDNHTIIGGNGANNPYRYYPMVISFDAGGGLLWSKQLIAVDTQTRIYSMAKRDSSVVMLTNEGVICVSNDGDAIWSKSIFYFDFYSASLLPPAIEKSSDGSFSFQLFGSPLWFSIFIKVSSSGDPVFSKNIYMNGAGVSEDFHNGVLAYGIGPYFGWPDRHAAQLGIYRFDSLGQGPYCVNNAGYGAVPAASYLQPQNLDVDDYIPWITDMTVTSADFQLLLLEDCVEMLDVPERPAILSLEIIPNPVETQSVINVNGLYQGNCSIRVFSQEGKIMFNDSFSGNQYLLKRGSLTNGLYFLHITDEKGNQISGKFIIR